MSPTEPSRARVTSKASALPHVRTVDPEIVLELQERERARVGFDLHDGPAQTMAAALLQLKMLETADDADLRDAFVELRATLSTALDEIYGLIEQFGGRASDGDRLEARVRSCVDKLASSTGIDAQLTFEGEADIASHSLQIAVFRIVQEALSNVRRHARARHVGVRVYFGASQVECEISDDGVGFTPDEELVPGPGRDHFGLHGMHQRARLLGGECVVDSGPGRGTRVTARIPIWLG